MLALYATNAVRPGRRIPVQPPIAGGPVVALGLVSTVGGGALPFAFGQGFKQGDVPSGATLGADTAVQITAKNYWPDGSLKFAIVSGQRALTANVRANVQLSIGGLVSSGSAMTTATLKATGITAGIGFGSFGTVSWADTDWDSPFYTLASGPEMSSWAYRKPIGADAHLVAWLEVRLFAGGQVEVVPWIENGYLTVAGPTAKSGTASFTLGGTSRYSASLNLLNHQRAVLASGTTFSHWLGTDPAVTPRHDTAYLQASKLVPNYRGVTAAGSALFSRIVQTYTPLAQSNYPTAMGATGYAPSIGLLPEWDVAYLTSNADSRAFASVIVNAYCAGRYGIHFRDQTTNRPLSFASYPNLVMDGSSGVAFVGASSTSSYTPTATGGSPPTYDSPHHPSMGYMAWLLTGRNYFVEEMQFLATTNFLKNTDTISSRQGTKGILRTDAGANIPRGVAWGIRSLAQAACATPDGDSLRTQLINSLNENVNFYHARYIAQAGNSQGFFKPYDHYNDNTPSLPWQAAPWMEDFLTASFGYAYDLAVHGSTFQTKFVELMAWKYGSIVGRLGPGTAGTWNYRYAAQYTIYYTPRNDSDWGDHTMAPAAGPWYADWGAIATAMSIPAADGGTSLQGGSGGGPELMTTGYWGNLQPALAYAVDHNATGALAAYNRLVNASNFATYSPGFNNDPVWGVKPRSV